MILTYIPQTVEVKTEDTTIRAHFRNCVEQHGYLDLGDAEQVIDWYAATCRQGRWFGFADFVNVRADLRRFDLEMWRDNTNPDEDEQIEKYTVRVETTLDNNRAKNPKKWLLDVWAYNDRGGPSIQHKIEWSRLPEEGLDWAGFQAGLARRNAFATLRKT